MINESTDLNFLFSQEKVYVKSPSIYLFIRRIIEVFIIMLSIPLTLPISFFVGITIKLSSKSNIFFIQERPGKNGIPFRLVKFRTMEESPSNIFKLTKKNDPRITALGRILRKYHLDELPQLWNVLKGEMSIIGPRPVPFELYDYYLDVIPNYDLRHIIRPGITGWAQVKLGYTNDLAGEQKKCQLDLFYLKHISLKYDLIILYKTFFCI